MEHIAEFWHAEVLAWEVAIAEDSYAVHKVASFEATS